MASRVSPESLARGSAQRPWIAIGLWALAFVIAGVLVGTLLNSGLTTEFTLTGNPESKRAETLLADRLRGPRSTNEVVIVQSDTRSVDDPVFQRFVLDLFGRLGALEPGIIKEGTLASYYTHKAGFLVSADRHATLIPFSMAGTFDDASQNIHRVSEAVDEANGLSEFKVLMTGQATVGKDFQEASASDIQKGETVGVPIALLILVLVFGAVVAALIPLVMAALCIVIALGVAALVGQLLQLSLFVTNMITMIGLAVGIDYSLFVVARYREERADGLDKIEAIARAGATATRAVFFSRWSWPSPAWCWCRPTSFSAWA